MTSAPNQPLTHADPKKPDDRLAADASAHLTNSPALQLMAELLTRLREMSFPWWTPDHLRGAYPASERMNWLRSRPDIRQKITTDLTGLAPRAARNKPPEFQAALVDSVIDDGDITVDVFENAFEPADLAVYGPAADFWRLFRKRAPWDDDSTPHQDIVGWLIGALLSDKSALDGSPRSPVLTALQVRTSIDGRVWHSRIPLHVRVAIDDARFQSQRERPGEPFGAERDLTIATPALIAASIPLKDLAGVLDIAGAALGFEGPDAPPPGARISFGREAAAKSSTGPIETADEVPGAHSGAVSSAVATVGTAAAPAVVPPAAPAVAPAAVPRPSPADDAPQISVAWTSEPPPRLVPAKSEPPPPSARGGLDGLSSRPSEPPRPARVAEPAPSSRTRSLADLIRDELDDVRTAQFANEPTRDEPGAEASDGEAGGAVATERSDPGESGEYEGVDDLEHTNPWIVPTLASDIAQAVEDIKGKGKTKGKGKRDADK